MSCGSTTSTAASAITITRGEHMTIALPAVVDDQKVAIDLTGAKVWFTVKNRVEDTSPAISKRNTLAGGADTEVLIVTPLEGLVEIYLIPTDTTNLTATTYIADVWVELASGKRWPIMRRRAFTIEASVTTVF